MRVPPAPTAELAEVSGKAFLGIIGQLKHRGGQPLLDKVIKLAGPPLAEVMRERVLVTRWYPYAAYTGLLVAMDALLGKGDLAYCKEIGRIAGERDLGTIFRVYAALASAERLIRACTKVWTSYYRNAGHMEAVHWAPERTVLRIIDFPAMHPGHCRLMEGWMISTMAQIGCLVQNGREARCCSRGDDHHEFACSWQKR
jgi:hypothetical protein